MIQEPVQLPHKLTMNERKHLTVTGVTEVVSFEEDIVLLHTVLGTLEVRGQELQLKDLSLEVGQAVLEGQISALTYQDDGQQESFWGRLFR